MKKLIVLSDGTGNSARALAKTNVWRTYQALDLATGDQLAQYDDGVGTSALKPLAILGGAFGWGLKRNVLHLYKFLCRNYEPGDEIYGFGFSRGAFTIRLLMGLVTKQGLVRAHSEEELDYLANAAYRAYRKQSFKRPASLSGIGRVVRDFFVDLQTRLLGLKKYDKDKNRQVDEVKFLGLWDTVDAYGVPIKELKAGIDRFIWPLLFENNEPSDKIAHACHALALDDERATFHPMVWNVTKIPRPERIQQLWFPGMHADVGGGYPDDALSHVPLLWILGEAAAPGRLRLKPEIVRNYELAASPLGTMHDSRSGITSYYRYSPRLATYLCDPTPPRIHPCVQDRIDHGGDRYAPISIPGPKGKELQYEMAWDTVWWRRAAYWAMLASTAFLVSLAFWELPAPWWDAWAQVIVNPLIDWAQSGAPIIEDPLDDMRKNPTAVLVCLLGIVACFLWGRLLAGRINDRAEEIWEQRTSDNQVEWFKQSILRWRAISVTNVVVAAGILFAAWYGDGAVGWAQGFLVVTILFALWRYKYDKDRKDQMKHGDATSIRGWSLRLAYIVRTSAPIVAFAKWTSHTAIPFLFALALVGGAFYAAYALLKVTGLFGMSV